MWKALVLVLAALPARHGFNSGFRSQLGGARGFPSAAPAVPFLTAFRSAIGVGSQCTGGAYTTDQGGTISITRASDKFCQRSDGVIFALGSADLLVVEQDGPLIESASTNLVPWSYDVVDQSSGTTSNTTLTGAQTGPDTDTKATKAQSTSNGGYYQSATFTIASTAAVASVFIKANSGTQAYAIRLWDTTSDAVVCTATGTATTTWTLEKARPYCLGSGMTSGHTFALRIYPGGTGGTGTVIFWAMQVEPALTFQPTSYIQTDGTAATRAADVVSVSISGHGINTAGCFSADTTFVVAEDSAHLFTVSGELAIANHLRPYLNDGTNVLFGPVSELNALTTTIKATWSGSTQYVYSGATSASGTFDGTMGSGSTLTLGSNAGVLQFLNGWMKNIKIGTSDSACN